MTIHSVPKYRNPKDWIITILSAIALVAFFANGPSAHAQMTSFSTYRLTDLGTLPDEKIRSSTPAAINGEGFMAGTSGNAAFYSNSQDKVPMKDVSQDPPDSIARGFGVNSSGWVVGDSTFGGDGLVSRAAVFCKDTTIDFFIGGKNSPYSRANAINNLGQVVGYSGPKLDGATSRAFIWSEATGVSDLGTLGGAYAQAYAINDSGFITGNSQIAGTDLAGTVHAFLYQPLTSTVSSKAMLDLGTLGGNSSYGTSINGINHVVGYSAIDKSRVHAFFTDGTKMRDLGSLGSKEQDQSFALGVNIADEIVGYSFLPAGQVIRTTAGLIRQPLQAAFISSQDVMVDLNQLLGAAGKSYWLYSAVAINDKGQIAASALNYENNEVHAVLLTPTGEYTTPGSSRKKR
jgi:probable HAF family extracellular repeat protein